MCGTLCSLALDEINLVVLEDEGIRQIELSNLDKVVIETDLWGVFILVNAPFCICIFPLDINDQSNVEIKH